MSWKATAYVKPLKEGPDGQHLTRSEKLLLLILADYHNEEQRGAWPSGKTLARDALLSLRYIWMLLESVRKKKILCIVHRTEKSGNAGNNFYRFHALDCGDDHEGGSELFALPPGSKSSQGGSEKRSLPSDLFSLGSDPAGSLPSEPGFTRGSEVASSLGSDPASAHKPQMNLHSEPQSEPPRTHAQSPLPLESPPSQAAGVCVTSDLTFQDYLRYARSQSSINSPEAWASIHFTKRDADYLVIEALYPQRLEGVIATQFGPPREFLDEKCSRCFGSKFEIIAGKGARHCPHCVDERGRSTGHEPKQVVQELSPLEEASPTAEEGERDAEELWQQARVELERVIPPQSFETWFRALQPIRIVAGKLILYAPNQVVRDWVTANYSVAIQAALAAIPYAGAQEFGWWEHVSPA